MKLYSSMEVQGALLLVVVNGEVSFNAAWDVLKQTYDTALEKQLNLILVDALAVEGKLLAGRLRRLHSPDRSENDSCPRLGVGVCPRSFLLGCPMEPPTPEMENGNPYPRRLIANKGSRFVLVRSLRRRQWLIKE